MRQTILSGITDPNTEAPFTGPMLADLQFGTVELMNSIMQKMIGKSYSSSVVYVLFGCVRSGAADGASSGTVTITAGAVFFNGEIYQVAAFTGTMGTGDAVYSAVDIIYPSVDPVNGNPLNPMTFYDGSTASIQANRTWLPAIAASGTTPQSGWLYLNKWVDLPITSGMLSVSGGGSVSTVAGNFFYKNYGGDLKFQIHITIGGGSGTINSITFTPTSPVFNIGGDANVFMGVDPINNVALYILGSGGVFVIQRVDGNPLTAGAMTIEVMGVANIS